GFGAVLQRLDATNVESHRGVEFERLAARGGLGAAEEDTDLLTQLVDEDTRGFGAVQTTRDLAQGLRHQPRLQTHVAVSHFSADLSLGHERRYGVDDDEVDRAGPDEHVCDLERLLTGIGLRDE